jgi:hypothetical protein
MSTLASTGNQDGLVAYPGTAIYPQIQGAPTGLVGALGAQVIDRTGRVVVARVTGGIIESPAGSGIYTASLLAPTVPGEYAVVFDTGTITPETTSAVALQVVALAPAAPALSPGAVTLGQLTWLRALLDDRAAPSVERVVASGAETEFFVSSPPIYTGGPVVVTATTPDGRSSSVLDPGDYAVTPFGDGIQFAQPPAADTQLVIRYVRLTWSDEELSGYLLAAAEEYVADQHIVYRAGIYALDTLLMGTATGFDFGVGADSFAFSSIFQRLLLLRGEWARWLEENADSEGFLVVQDFYFDSIEPGDIDDAPGNHIWGGVGGYFPNSPAGRGGLSG